MDGYVVERGVAVFFSPKGQQWKHTLLLLMTGDSVGMSLGRGALCFRLSFLMVCGSATSLVRLVPLLLLLLHAAMPAAAAPEAAAQHDGTGYRRVADGAHRGAALPLPGDVWAEGDSFEAVEKTLEVVFHPHSLPAEWRGGKGLLAVANSDWATLIAHVNAQLLSSVDDTAFDPAYVHARNGATGVNLLIAQAVPGLNPAGSPRVLTRRSRSSSSPSFPFSGGLQRRDRGRARPLRVVPLCDQHDRSRQDLRHDAPPRAPRAAAGLSQCRDGRRRCQYVSHARLCASPRLLADAFRLHLLSPSPRLRPQWCGTRG